VPGWRGEEKGYGERTENGKEFDLIICGRIVMRISMFRSVLVLGLLVIGGLAHADDKAVREILKANYARFAEAYRKNNIEAVSSFLTPDYTSTQSNGQKLTREATIKALRQQRASLSGATIENKIDKLTVKGSQAIAIVHARMSGTIADPQGKRHTLVAIAVSTDTWIKTASGWKIKSDVAQQETLKMDGKLMNLGGTPK
jgi:ketosteroid isomerase-like protein